MVTFDGYKERIYIDSELIKEKDIFLRVAPGKKLTLGCKFEGEHRFRGYLHSLQLYDIPLNEEQIKNLYSGKILKLKY